MSAQRGWVISNRLEGLRRFATAITVFTILGHLWFGFEQSWLQPVVAVLTGYTLELLLEWVDARAHGRAPRYRGGGFVGLVNFLLSAHITSLAVAMLLYANERLWPLAFAVSVAIGTKAMFRIAIGGRPRHFLNPSNTGITITLLLFPWVGIAQPYHFTENLHGVGDWILPGLIVVSGSFLNFRYTRRVPLLLTWIVVFALQAVVRIVFFDSEPIAPFLPMTGVAFVLFTFYMVTDPATTPSSVTGQIVFGAAVAVAYGALVVFHIVFGLFFGLTIVCVARGVIIALRNATPAPKTVAAPAALVVEGGGHVR
ncbi:MAG: enediyne biosynthesis protein UnbU [Planctomycetes bacterium]|nr:enediyne biosynthesis protein UnbU [Planctomycetota bacterium]